MKPGWRAMKRARSVIRDKASVCLLCSGSTTVICVTIYLSVFICGSPARAHGHVRQGVRYTGGTAFPHQSAGLQHRPGHIERDAGTGNPGLSRRDRTIRNTAFIDG